MRVRPEANFVLDIGYEVVVDGKKQFVALPESIPLDDQMLKMMGPQFVEAAKAMRVGDVQRLELAVKVMRAHPETGVLPRRDVPPGTNHQDPSDDLPAVRPFAFGGDVSINSIDIKGRWNSGVALDRHTDWSSYVGRDDRGRKLFETSSPDLGRLLYDFKYQGYQPAAFGIVAAAVGFLEPFRAGFDLLIPAPPSEQREFQPVTILANGIGGGWACRSWPRVAKTRPTRPFKGLSDAEKLQELRGWRFRRHRSGADQGNERARDRRHR
ncbi:hypothetical protein [Dankookia sp. P2]|uniref:hypothetical protein n=1 Tax=Dankookia sp. P2 TaxID=3423955 RepID=UPI003D667C38